MIKPTLSAQLCPYIAYIEGQPGPGNLSFMYKFLKTIIKTSRAGLKPFCYHLEQPVPADKLQLVFHHLQTLNLSVSIIDIN